MLEGLTYFFSYDTLYFDCLDCGKSISFREMSSVTCLFVGLLLNGVDLEGELVDLPLGAPQQRQVAVLRLRVLQ